MVHGVKGSSGFDLVICVKMWYYVGTYTERYMHNCVIRKASFVVHGLPVENIVNLRNYQAF